MYKDISTWLVCNFLIAVAVHGSISNELDPVLHLGNPGIHTIAGAFYSKTHHTDRRESTERNEGSCLCAMCAAQYLPSILRYHQWASRISLAWILVAVTRTNVETKYVCRYIFLYLLVKIILLPFNFARIISVTLFVRHDRHLNLLECWCWTAIRGGVPPPSHRGHLASVQGLGGGGEAKWGNSGGEGEREGQEEDREIIISGVKIISGVIPDLRNIS